MLSLSFRSIFVCHSVAKRRNLLFARATALYTITQIALIRVHPLLSVVASVLRANSVRLFSLLKITVLGMKILDVWLQIR